MLNNLPFSRTNISKATRHYEVPDLDQVRGDLAGSQQDSSRERCTQFDNCDDGGMTYTMVKLKYETDAKKIGKHYTLLQWAGAL